MLAIDRAELPLLDEILDPPRQIFRWRRPDTVGFGVEDAVQWASPYVVAAALWYGTVLFDEAKSVVEERTRATVRKLTRRKTVKVAPPEIADGARLTEAERTEHVQRVRAYAVSLGLDETRAALLADAVVGSMLREQAEPVGDG